MKKGFILILIMALFAEIVNAQEIKIFGQSYSIILVAPIALMAVFVLIFLLVFIKDSLSNFHLPKIDFKFLRLKHKIHKKEEIKDNVDIGARFYNLKLKANKIPLNNYFDELTDIAKIYLKTKYNVKQELLFEEFPNLAKNANRNELNLADKIASLKYSGVELIHEDIEKINDIMEKLIKYQPQLREVHKQNLFLNLKEIFIKKHKVKQELSPLTAPERTEIKEKSENLITNFFTNIKKNKILSILNKGKLYIYTNPIKAKRSYGQALLKYYNLKIRDDKGVSNKLNEFRRMMLKINNKDKHFFDISNKIIALKHSGKSLSFEALNSIKSLRILLEQEEKLSSIKLREFSKKLNLEEQKLKHLSANKNLYLSRVTEKIGKRINSGIGEIEQGIIKEKHSIGEGIRSRIDNIKDNIEKKEHSIGEKFKNIREKFKTKENEFIEKLRKDNEERKRFIDLVEKTPFKPQHYVERELLRDYITAELPKYTKIKQIKKIPASKLEHIGIESNQEMEEKQTAVKLPLPKIDPIKKIRYSKKVNELRKEEQEIYEKLSNLDTDLSKKVLKQNYVFGASKYLKAKTSQKQKINQNEFKNEMQSKKINELKKEEQAIYEKLSNISKF